MLAMMLEAPHPVDENPLAPTQVPIPEPGPGQIRVKVGACGVCHTDLHTVEGELDLPLLPITPGHQVVGRVDELGAGCRRFRTGDRVGLAWLYRTCGQCEFCRRGDENLCERAEFTGLHAHGGYAPYTIVDEDFAYRLPEGFGDLEAAPLLCAGIIGYRSYRLSNVRPGRRLGLYGFGAAAHILIQIAVHQGVEVYVFTRGPGHQDLARDLGAAWVGRAEDDPPQKLDSAIIFAPAGALVPEALRVLKPGGTLALGGIYMSPTPPLDYQKHLWHERVIRSVANLTRADGRGLLDLAARIPVRTEVQTYPYLEANRALQDLKHGRVNGAAVLVFD
ncbi:MAG: zinc-dependent alcohol dehydrogenase family protein [Proteobacteria bacterium]|nr:zinc-dependent alcohol dehydrogenase family protein [Pseudomonadota bacterium]